MPTNDSDLSVPVDYFIDCLFNPDQHVAINSDFEQKKRDLRSFRGDVVARGFDIENVLSEIICHLLFLNRPRYIGETKDEFDTYLNVRSFFRHNILDGRAWTFRRKFEFAEQLVHSLPPRLRKECVLPKREIDKALNWRNAFAHDRIEFRVKKNKSVMAVMFKGRQNGQGLNLTASLLKTIAGEMEEAFDACVKLNRNLCGRYSNNRREAKPAVSGQSPA